MTKRSSLAGKKVSGPAFGQKKTKWRPNLAAILLFSDRNPDSKSVREMTVRISDGPAFRCILLSV
jgi:hypothetical protein